MRAHYFGEDHIILTGKALINGDPATSLFYPVPYKQYYIEILEGYAILGGDSKDIAWGPLPYGMEEGDTALFIMSDKSAGQSWFGWEIFSDTAEAVNEEFLWEYFNRKKDALTRMSYNGMVKGKTQRQLALIEEILSIGKEARCINEKKLGVARACLRMRSPKP